jgi:hypothetical protein
MRTARLLLLAAFITVCSVLVSCGAPASNPVEPVVGYIPEGWSLSAQHPYDTYWEEDGTKWGSVEYTDESDWDSLAIFYGDVPPELKGNETDGDTLMSQAADYLAPIEPTELGTITIGDHLAGYACVFDDDHGCCDAEIVFVMDSTCIDICTRYGTTYPEDEVEVVSLISSIH